MAFNAEAQYIVHPIQKEVLMKNKVSKLMIFEVNEETGSELIHDIYSTEKDGTCYWWESFYKRNEKRCIGTQVAHYKKYSMIGAKKYNCGDSTVTTERMEERYCKNSRHTYFSRKDTYIDFHDIEIKYRDSVYKELYCDTTIRLFHKDTMYIGIRSFNGLEDNYVYSEFKNGVKIETERSVTIFDKGKPIEFNMYKNGGLVYTYNKYDDVNNKTNWLEKNENNNPLPTVDIRTDTTYFADEKMSIKAVKKSERNYFLVKSTIPYYDQYTNGITSQRFHSKNGLPLWEKNGTEPKRIFKYSYFK